MGVTGNRGWSASSLSPVQRPLRAQRRPLPQPVPRPRRRRVHRRLRRRPARRARHHDRRRRRLPDRRADPGRRRFHHPARRPVRRPPSGVPASTASSSSPTRCRPAGAAPASTSGATRPTASSPTCSPSPRASATGSRSPASSRPPTLMDCVQANSISTFGGNPLVCAGGAGQPPVPARPRPPGQRPAPGRSASSTASSRSSTTLDVVGDVRGKGLMIGVELVGRRRHAPPNPAAAAARARGGRERGLLIGKGGLYGNCLRIAPPLTLTDDECAEGAADPRRRHPVGGGGAIASPSVRLPQLVRGTRVRREDHRHDRRDSHADRRRPRHHRRGLDRDVALRRA